MRESSHLRDARIMLLPVWAAWRSNDSLLLARSSLREARAALQQIEYATALAALPLRVCRWARSALVVGDIRTDGGSNSQHVSADTSANERIA